MKHILSHKVSHIEKAIYSLHDQENAKSLCLRTRFLVSMDEVVVQHCWIIQVLYSYSYVETLDRLLALVLYIFVVNYHLMPLSRPRTREF